MTPDVKLELAKHNMHGQDEHRCPCSKSAQATVLVSDSSMIALRAGSLGFIAITDTLIHMGDMTICMQFCMIGNSLC